jgi:hypothetical protein
VGQGCASRSDPPFPSARGNCDEVVESEVAERHIPAFIPETGVLSLPAVSGPGWGRVEAGGILAAVYTGVCSSVRSFPSSRDIIRVHKYNRVLLPRRQANVAL